MRTFLCLAILVVVDYFKIPRPPAIIMFLMAIAMVLAILQDLNEVKRGELFKK